VNLGLLEEASGDRLFDINSLDRLDHAQETVMSLYVRDTEAKLGVFSDLSLRVQLLLDNVNEKFINKRLRVDQREGLIAETIDKKPLKLNELSSGEQHEVVLLYHLLFSVRPNTLVLIDEPELSLHLVWQKRFLNDLLEIAKTANFDALVATHSPFIASDRNDLMIDLDTTVQARSA
jgi:predicted ATP-binding protein involved in virulence